MEDHVIGLFEDTSAAAAVVVADEQALVDSDDFLSSIYDPCTVNNDRLSKNELKESVECESSGKLVVSDDIKRREKKPIGDGTYGKVFLVIEETKEVALKLPNDTPQVQKEANDSINIEIDALKHLKHKNIIELINYGSNKDSPWFTMMYCGENASLRYMVDNRKSELTLDAIKSITRQLLEAVSFMHQNHYIHCDLKSDNILITRDLTVKLIDFGSVKSFTDHVDLTDAVVGTQYTMAPELMNMGDGIVYDHKIDIYSIGCIVIEMHKGVRERSIYGDNPSCPEGISDVEVKFLSHCLDRDRKTRYTTGELLKHEFLNQ